MKVHFFTIVLNGMPFIKHHYNEFNKLPFPWHWSIIEGVADLKQDTGWGLRDGAVIPIGFHKDGLSVDGTTEYLDGITDKRITVYRVHNRFWNCKTEMVNQPLGAIQEDCLLWQVDHDELWSHKNIEKVYELFHSHPEKTSAYFYCYYFLGPKKYIVSPNVKSTRPTDWLRVWRFTQGAKWATHEPPILIDKEGGNIGAINPFSTEETLKEEITFQHFAYSTLESVAFKEYYYGYKGLINVWKKLQTFKGWVEIGSGFPGVQVGTIVDDWPEEKSVELLWPKN